jgi:hypothetical protein
MHSSYETSLFQPRCTQEIHPLLNARPVGKQETAGDPASISSFHTGDFDVYAQSVGLPGGMNGKSG